MVHSSLYLTIGNSNAMETLNRLKDLKSVSESFEKSLEDDLTNYSIWFLIFTY